MPPLVTTGQLALSMLEQLLNNRTYSNGIRLEVEFSEDAERVTVEIGSPA